jgi:UDP-2,3-diacylglucosamine pyrophosphatase LpxH
VPGAPSRVLIASDFHLGSGWDPVTNTCVATENFLADGAFRAWIEHYAEGAAETLLILNGDTFDVLRVTETPRTDDDFERWSERLDALARPRPTDELRAAVSKSERRYGLQTDDYKTVWKLLLTADGHPRFFDALTYWINAGGDLLFTTGNHDVELHWPLVQMAIRWELAARGAVDADARVRFAEGWVVFDNLYVEHGHQYDEMTRVDGPAELPPDHTQINLPLGSFVNRYLINQVEALDPFIDNVKPVQRSLLRLARQRPLKIVRTYFGGWRFLRRAVAKRRLNWSVAVIGLGLILPVFTPLVLLAIPGVRNTVLGWLPIPEGARAAVVLVLGLLLSGAFPWLLGLVGELTRRRPGTDHQLEGARAASRAHFGEHERAYVCMGHTHVSAVRRIDDAGDKLYLNTGTWIALWPDNRPDLLGRTTYTYALFEQTGDGYTAQVLEWDTHADRPQPATILVPATSSS